jgi:hypothetical protein
MSLAETVDRIEGLSEEQRECIENCNEATEGCEWCADECLGDSDMEECARLCRDVADLAMLNVRFIARDSVFGPDIAEAFAYAAEECARECSRHPNEHCQECASRLWRAVDSTWDMLENLGGRAEQTPSQ